MLHSSERILTTHAGSLPRPRELCEMFAHLSRREVVNEANLHVSIETATREVIRKQLEAGIDISNNGEQSRESFFSYVQHRMSGFGERGERLGFADLIAYPSYLTRFAATRADPVSVDLMHPAKAIGRGPLRKSSAVGPRVRGLRAHHRRLQAGFSRVRYDRPVAGDYRVGDAQRGLPESRSLCRMRWWRRFGSSTRRSLDRG